MKKRSGTIFTEVLISILMFLVGLLALIGAISFSVNSIMRSREAIASDMAVANAAEYDTMRLAISSDAALSGENKMTVSVSIAPQSGDNVGNAISFSCDLYSYKAENKYKTTFYLLKRNN